MGAPATATAGGFQFITSINTITRDDETRRKVRSHARRQKLSSQPGTAPTKTQTASQKERTGKFRVGQSNCTSTSTPVPASSGSVVTSKTAAARKKRLAQDGERPRPSGTVLVPTLQRGASSSSDLSDCSTDEEYKSDMITRELAFTTVGVTKELPNFSALSIKTTPMTEQLLRYMMTVCLSPKEESVQKWFTRTGAPTYMTTRKPCFPLLVAFGCGSAPPTSLKMIFRAYWSSSARSRAGHRLNPNRLPIWEILGSVGGHEIVMHSLGLSHQIAATRMTAVHKDANTCCGHSIL